MMYKQKDNSPKSALILWSFCSALTVIHDTLSIHDQFSCEGKSGLLIICSWHIL